MTTLKTSRRVRASSRRAWGRPPAAGLAPATAGAVAVAEHTYEANRVALIFNGSDGDATRALYDELAGYGPIGLVAINLFRAQKCSARAKIYSRGHYSTLAYGRKNWSLEQLTAILIKHDTLGYPFGWKEDPEAPRYPWVLYVDLPQGQVSFHAIERGAGPDYAGEWDHIPDASTGRILRFVNTVLAAPGVAHDQSATPVGPDQSATARRSKPAVPGRRQRVNPRPRHRADRRS